MFLHIGPIAHPQSESSSFLSIGHEEDQVTAVQSHRWRKVAMGAGLTVAVLAGVVIFAIRGGPPPDEPAAPVATGVALTVAGIRPRPVLWPEFVSANGAIGAWQEASVGAEVAGVRLIEVLADVGDQVTAGQLLARFDPAPMQAALAQQQASLAEAEARLTEALANAKRATQLRQTQMLSEQDLIKAVTAAQAAEAQVALARARVQSQKLSLENTRVVAPDDGVISTRTAMLGAVAAPGSELFRLVRQNRLEWRAELTGADLAVIEIGHHAEVTLPDGTVIGGTVRQVAPVLDTGSRTGLVYVALDQTTSPGSARAGMFVGGRILRDERQGLSLPGSAIVMRDGYAFVFVIRGEEQQAIQTKVTIGRRLGDEVEIVAGVTADDVVVASGGAFLTDGDRVRVVESSTASRAAQGEAS